MNTREARTIIAKELLPYRKKSYADLRGMIDAEPVTYEVRGDGQANFQIEIQAFWDDEPGGDIRVRGAIDDGGFRAYFPLCEDFILAPSGKFVDE